MFGCTYSQQKASSCKIMVYVHSVSLYYQEKPPIAKSNGDLPSV